MGFEKIIASVQKLNTNKTSRQIKRKQFFSKARISKKTGLLSLFFAYMEV